MPAERTERPGCLAAFLNLFRTRTRLGAVLGEPPETISEDTGSEAPPYRIRDDFLSPAEFSYYRVLKSVLGARATVCTKVRLADILFVARPHENQAYLNRISSKHVDFLLCDSSTMTPVVAIELDDASHKREDRRQRDEFVDNALHAAGLPLVRVPPQHDYTQEEIIAQLRPILLAFPSAAPRSFSSGEAGAKAVSADAAPPQTPLCPKCGIPMVLRTAGRGKDKGGQFYGCRNFPRCRQVLPVSAQRMLRPNTSFEPTRRAGFHLIVPRLPAGPTIKSYCPNPPSGSIRGRWADVLRCVISVGIVSPGPIHWPEAYTAIPANGG